CRECHGTRFNRRRAQADWTARTDLNFLEDWKLAEFITTTRTPIDPNGHEPSEEMPWRPIGRMDDDELAAVYEFLAHLPVLNMPAIYRATRLPCASRYRCYWT